MTLEHLREATTGRAIAHQILLVEDDPDTAAFIKRFLEQRGFDVSIAKDGGQAQAMFVMRKPDFVILDLILPGESGFEVCQRFKLGEPAVPVLILSAIDMPDARALAERVGADGYLTKPFDPDELVANIHDIAEIVWERVHRDRPREPGRVRFSCICGKRFKVSSSHRGKSLTCPDCGEPLIVPRHD
jgi:two-component system, OmpR family, response regulator